VDALDGGQAVALAARSGAALVGAGG
jgi:hypothetical protein